MLRGLVGAALISTLLLWTLGWSGALANEGVLAGWEWLALLVVGVLSALVFWAFARLGGLGTVKILVVGAVISMALPLLVLLAPTLFCILFMPNTSCV